MSKVVNHSSAYAQQVAALVDCTSFRPGARPISLNQLAFCRIFSFNLVSRLPRSLSSCQLCIQCMGSDGRGISHKFNSRPHLNDQAKLLVGKLRIPWKYGAGANIRAFYYHLALKS